LALSKKSARSSALRSSGNRLTRYLEPLVRSAIVFVHHAKFLRQAEKAFRMPDKKIAAGIQAMPELLDEALLLGFIKNKSSRCGTDHVVAARQEFGLQIVKVELHELL